MSAIICVALLFTQNDVFLPKWMTAEESLLVGEIGKRYEATASPGGWVETPAEYEPLRGVWLTWDYGWFDAIEREIVREVSEVCKAYIIAAAGDTISIRNYLISGGVSLDSVRFYVFPYNSIWIRDYGPWFIRKENNTEGIVDYIYNRPARPADDTIPWRISQAWGIPYYLLTLWHPGGNFMVDGLGTGFFSSLIYEENPSYTPQQIDSLMLVYNGLEYTIPLQRILTEYTGHIDLWTKILDDTLVMVGEYAAGHPNDTVLDNRADSIASCKNREGFSYRVVRIVMPYDLSDAPPTYLNSLFVNNKILVPTWGLPEDPIGLATYQQYLPGYEVVGINCSAMSGSGGAIHCITMQVPSDRYIHVLHVPLSDTNDILNPYRVRARVITSSALLVESTLVFYKINSSPTFNTTPLSAVIDTPGVYAGYIPPQSVGDTVYYYLLAKNTQGIRRTSPAYVPPQIYSFRILPGVSVAETNVSFINEFAIFPNPVHNNLNFSLRLTKPTRVKIEIYNVLGQLVKLITNAQYNKGKNIIQWNLDDEANRRLANGAYFYRITMDKDTITGKLLLVR